MRWHHLPAIQPVLCQLQSLDCLQRLPHVEHIAVVQSGCYQCMCDCCQALLIQLRTKLIYVKDLETGKHRVIEDTYKFFFCKTIVFTVTVVPRLASAP